MGSAPVHQGCGRQGIFPSQRPVSGEELWVTDGTTAGTRLAAKMVPVSWFRRVGARPTGAGGEKPVFSEVTKETGCEPYVLAVGAILDFHAWTEEAGLAGLDAAPIATPHSDGVGNLLKYAFGID